MPKNNKIQFSQLLDMNNPAAVFEEVKANFIHYYPINEFRDIRITFKVFNDLYDGKYPGYLGCNTKYHDKVHTADALLAISRLIDGYNIKNGKLPVAKVKIALMATILHDSGYIQRKSDKKGTGAKYTLSHVDRSIVFLKGYFKKAGYSGKDYISARNMINCTGLFTKVTEIKFNDRQEKLLGYMLGAADIIGQMASRTYLEKLLFLFHEFEEGEVCGYASEFDLLKKTLSFYDSIRVWLDKDLQNISRYVLYHFKRRYGLNKDLYEESINRHMIHLKSIIKSGPKNFRSKLRRYSEMQKVL